VGEWVGFRVLWLGSSIQWAVGMLEVVWVLVSSSVA